MKHSGRSKKCVSYHVIDAGDNDRIWLWVGSAIRIKHQQSLCSVKPSTYNPGFFLHQTFLYWLVCWYDIYKLMIYIVTEDDSGLNCVIWNWPRYVSFAVYLIWSFYQTSNPRSQKIWCVGVFRGMGVGSVPTKWPLLFFPSNLIFYILGFRPPGSTRPTHLKEGFQMIS